MYASPWGTIDTKGKFLGYPNIAAYWWAAPNDWNGQIDQKNPHNWIKEYLVDNKYSKWPSIDKEFLEWNKLGRPKQL